jgi:hypothetical protein
METLETLIEYCKADNKAIPHIWHIQFWDLLKEIHQIKGGIEPPMPFILAALSLPNEEKQARLFEQLEWADEQGEIEKLGTYLRSIEKNKWTYFKTK